MTEAKRFGWGPLGQRSQDLYRKLMELNDQGDLCLACHVDTAELMTLLEAEGLNPKEVEAEVQKIATDFQFVLPEKTPMRSWDRGALSSMPGRCGEGAFLPFFFAACYAVMSRQEGR